MGTDDTGSTDLPALLSAGGVHVVCFADARAQEASSLMATGAGLDETERRLFCERVNAEDATGSLWPIARLSALPARFAESAHREPAALEACLLRVFELNASLCKCPILVLDLRGATAVNAAWIADAARRLQATRGEISLVRELRVL